MQQALAARRIHAALAGQVLDRVAGYKVNQRERKQRHADERRDDQRDTTQDEGEHRPLMRYPQQRRLAKFVIPAEAGIHFSLRPKNLDPRVRGDDVGPKLVHGAFDEAGAISTLLK